MEKIKSDFSDATKDVLLKNLSTKNDYLNSNIDFKEKKEMCEGCETVGKIKKREKHFFEYFIGLW
jgi:hypothetical protein